MENKYFTPDIEDLCIGYELEVHYNFKLNGIFHKKIIENFEELADIHSRMSGDCVIRIPYLTKEQIEAEGWKHDERYDDVKHFYINELHLTLYIGYLKEEIIYHHISIFHGGGIMFRGECKDINTFRKIIKLLGI